jgi:NTP pyrophosphatase (non-canonical NTP hydrolase)
MEQPPDKNCYTLPDGSCIGGTVMGREPCMHDPPDAVKPQELTFLHLRSANVARMYSDIHQCLDWEATEWACALAGEVGEACNLIKKQRMGKAISKKEIADELADVQTYLDLLANHLNIDLAAATISKFNEVSDRHNSLIKLEA